MKRGIIAVARMIGLSAFTFTPGGETFAFDDNVAFTFTE